MTERLDEMTPATENLMRYDWDAGCPEATEFMGVRHRCDRPFGHTGQHGSGPLIAYSLMWGDA